MQTYTRVSTQHGSSAGLSFSKIILKTKLFYISEFAYSAVTICLPNIHKDWWHLLFLLSLICLFFVIIIIITIIIIIITHPDRNAQK